MILWHESLQGKCGLNRTGLYTTYKVTTCDFRVTNDPVKKKEKRKVVFLESALINSYFKGAWIKEEKMGIWQEKWLGSATELHRWCQEDSYLWWVRRQQIATTDSPHWPIFAWIMSLDLYENPVNYYHNYNLILNCEYFYNYYHLMTIESNTERLCNLPRIMQPRKKRLSVLFISLLFFLL